jgi:hypothetical protein
MTCRQRFSNVGTSEKEKERRVDPLGEEEAENIYISRSHEEDGCDINPILIVRLFE